MNLKMYGKFGWQWTYAGETWHTGDNGCGLYCGKALMDAQFKAPRSRMMMIKFLGRQ